MGDRSVRDGSILPFRVLKHLIMYDCVGICIHRDENADSRFALPLPFELRLPADVLHWHSDYELRVDNWKNFVYLSTNSVHRPAVAGHTPSKLGAGVYVVLPPFLYPTSPEFASHVLYHHVVYHTRLGYAGAIQYATSIYLEYFVQDAKLVRLVREGVLSLVLWDATTECTDHPKCFQSVIHSYSLLSHFGSRGILLHMLDHDEFVAISRPGRHIQDVIMKCFNGSDHVMFERFDTHCSTCNADGATAEEGLWERSWEMAPLTSYDVRNVEPHRADLGKSMASPESVLVFGVHAGVTPDGHGPTSINDTSCGAYVAHFPNLFEQREFLQQKPMEKRVDTINDIRWHWVMSKPM